MTEEKNKKNNNFLYLTATIIVLILAGYFLAKNIPVNIGQKTQNNSQPVQKFEVWEGDLPPLGDPSAPVKVIEFGDFHCPFCAWTAVEFYPQLEKYAKEGKVVFYFRDFPLEQLHPQAIKVHLASRCVNEQDSQKYWDFHKRVFLDYYQRRMQNNEITFNTADETYLENLVKELNLDVKKFKDCLTSQKYKDQIIRDLKDGESLGVNGTPTFFVNGEMVVGANFEGLKLTIEKNLK